MLRFEIARLLDQSTLDIFSFFPDYGTDKMPFNEDYHFTIYVVKDANEVFYVGKSDDCFDRLRTHLGIEYRGHRTIDMLGALIIRNLPESRQWTVELYTNEETKYIIPRSFYNGFIYWPTHLAETAMIRTLKPYLNVSHNKDNRRDIPSRYR